MYINLQINTEEITETVVEKIEEIPVKNDTTEDHTNVEMSENAGNDEERDLVTPVRSSTRKSGVKPMEINNEGKKYLIFFLFYQLAKLVFNLLFSSYYSLKFVFSIIRYITFQYG